VGVRARDTMGDVTLEEKLMVKFLIFPVPIRLHTFYFSVEEVFNMRLKEHKNVLCISSVIHKINPCEFAKVINKANVILKSINKSGRRIPNIRKDKLKWRSRSMNGIIIW
jgi:hypothetical protein